MHRRFVHKLQLKLPANSTPQQPTLHQTIHFGHVTEHTLPQQLSQCTIFGIPLGSNACTIIAALGATKFLETILNSVAVFANSMKNGNLLYQSLKLPPDQPNLDAREALQTRSDNFGLQIVEEPAIYFPAFMTDKLNQIYAPTHKTSV